MLRGLTSYLTNKMDKLLELVNSCWLTQRKTTCVVTIDMKVGRVGHRLSMLTSSTYIHHHVIQHHVLHLLSSTSITPGTQPQMLTTRTHQLLKNNPKCKRLSTLNQPRQSPILRPNSSPIYSSHPINIALNTLSFCQDLMSLHSTEEM